MESNSDKQMREKLSGAEFPFDPKAWTEMEEMLDKKKKRRGFFWWWTGGVAAALLFGLIGYELGVNSSRTMEPESTVNSPQPTENTGKESIFHSPQSTENAEKESTVYVLQPTVIEQQSSNSTSSEGTTTSETNSGVNGLANNQSAKSASSAVQQTSSSEISNNASAKASRKKQREAGKASTYFNGDDATTVNNQSAKSVSSAAQIEEAQLLASVSGRTSLAERIEMDRRAGLLEASKEEYSLSKKNDETLPRTQKKKFQYSLGVVANITGTTVGTQRYSEDPYSSLAYTRKPTPLFYNKVSYGVGLTHEFLFLNRVAISNSILYAQTGFKIFNPSAPYDSSATRNYSSAISELQIPLGIKVYPVSKNCFRFSIAAGIINHIKLKEVFTVEKETPTVIPNNIAMEANTFVATADNPFLGGIKANTMLDSYSSSSPDVQGEYYGMGGLRRYYASFYASAGVEFIAKKHLIFFTEPMFYMSLNKIGLQDKRKYNVGANAGFRYQF